MKTRPTRRARGGLGLNRTLRLYVNSEAATASRTRRQPRKKNASCILFLAEGCVYKNERALFVRGYSLQVLGRGGFYSESAVGTFFLFCKRCFLFRDSRESKLFFDLLLSSGMRVKVL